MLFPERTLIMPTLIFQGVPETRILENMGRSSNEKKLGVYALPKIEVGTTRQDLVRDD